MTNRKRRIITIKGKVEERKEPEAAEMETVHLVVAAKVTQERRTTEENVILKGETAVDLPEDAQAHLEVGVALHLHQGDNIIEVIQIITI